MKKSMRVKFATYEHQGTKRISMSRDEILATVSSLDARDKENERLIWFLQHLEKELVNT